jgi:hypothetical protein
MLNVDLDHFQSFLGHFLSLSSRSSFIEKGSMYAAEVLFEHIIPASRRGDWADVTEIEACSDTVASDVKNLVGVYCAMSSYPGMKMVEGGWVWPLVEDSAIEGGTDAVGRGQDQGRDSSFLQ